MNNGSLYDYRVVYSTGLKYLDNDCDIFEDDIVEVSGLGKVRISINPLYGVEYIDLSGVVLASYADCAMEGDYPKFIKHVVE